MAKAKKTQAAAESENTVLWNRCSTTPGEYLKDFKRGGGFQGLSIDPVYRIRLLTEMFGPCGKGWGFIQEDQWTDGGSGAYVVYVRGHLWYMLDGERYQTMSHTGGTNTDRTPDESYKMAETDALGKCCLDLGLAADVYMGVHDADKYQDNSPQSYRGNAATAGRRQAGSKPSNAPTVEDAAMLIVDAEVQGILKAIDALPDDVEAYSYARKLFNRMLISKDLDERALPALAERMLVKRCSFATESLLPDLMKIGKAYVKQGWLTEVTVNNSIALCERRLGIPPKSSTKE